MDVYGLIGKSLAHSFSKRYFTKKFKKEGIQARYKLFELEEIAELPWRLRAEPTLRGFNVTIPYKESIIPFLHHISPEAEAIGAVNTVCMLPTGLEGHNTDAYGFATSLKTLLGSKRLSSALILGTGGAAKAVHYVLTNQLGFLNVSFVSRTPLSDQFSYEALFELDLNNFPLIVNTTPLGTYPNIDSCPPIPYQQLGSDHFVFDLVYNPEETLMMRHARSKGAMVQNGSEMLRLQAEGAWEIWNRY